MVASEYPADIMPGQCQYGLGGGLPRLGHFCDSSVSSSSSASGMEATASALNFSPTERYMPFDQYIRAVCALPRNPCLIHGILGFVWRWMASMMSAAFTSWIIRGLRNRSDSAICMRSSSSCRVAGAPFSRSMPVSPMAAISGRARILHNFPMSSFPVPAVSHG